MKIRVYGVGTFLSLTEAAVAWAQDQAKTCPMLPDETPESAAARIEAGAWAQLPEAPKGTEREQWRDGCRYELERVFAGKAPTRTARQRVEEALKRPGAPKRADLARRVGIAAESLTRWLNGDRDSVPLFYVDRIASELEI